LIIRHFERGDVLPKDKLLHLIAGFVIALVGTMLFDKITGLGLAVIAGAFKEIYDYHNPKKHSVEFLDFIATVVGGVIIMILL
jgi:uncharacterized membrane protein YeaQ/YmgE (transglycosylase-associated protein family)